jgi:hypothetical protein
MLQRHAREVENKALTPKLKRRRRDESLAHYVPEARFAR